MALGSTPTAEILSLVSPVQYLSFQAGVDIIAGEIFRYNEVLSISRGDFAIGDYAVCDQGATARFPKNIGLEFLSGQTVKWDDSIHSIVLETDKSIADGFVVGDAGLDESQVIVFFSRRSEY